MAAAPPLHGLKLVIKEAVLPMKDQPEFPALALLAARGLLAPDTWKCRRAQVSLKATMDVLMLGTIIEHGDGLLSPSLYLPTQAYHLGISSNALWLPPDRSTCFKACCIWD